MPTSKKRKKRERKTRRPGDGEPAAPERAVEQASGVLLSRMRGGVQSVAGAGVKKRESLLSRILTWGLVALAAYLLARRFGIIR